MRRGNLPASCSGRRGERGVEFLAVMTSILSAAAALTSMLANGVGAWQRYRQRKSARPVRSDATGDIDPVPDLARSAGAESNAH